MCVSIFICCHFQFCELNVLMGKRSMTVYGLAAEALERENGDNFNKIREHTLHKARGKEGHIEMNGVLSFAFLYLSSFSWCTCTERQRQKREKKGRN